MSHRLCQFFACLFDCSTANSPKLFLKSNPTSRNHFSNPTQHLVKLFEYIYATHLVLPNLICFEFSIPPILLLPKSTTSMMYFGVNVIWVVLLKHQFDICKKNFPFSNPLKNLYWYKWVSVVI